MSYIVLHYPLNATVSLSLQQVSKKMFIPSETLEAMRAARMGATAAAAASTDGEAESASASGRVGSVAHARVK